MEKDSRKLPRQLGEFIRFNIVGIINTAITYGIYALVVYLTENYTAGVACDYAFGIVFSFLLNKYITFKNHDRITVVMVLKMILSYLPSFLLNLVSLHILIGMWGWNKYAAQLVTAACIAVISYILQKLFVFRKN